MNVFVRCFLSYSFALLLFFSMKRNLRSHHSESQCFIKVSGKALQFCGLSVSKYCGKWQHSIKIQLEIRICVSFVIYCLIISYGVLAHCVFEKTKLFLFFNKKVGLDLNKQKKCYRSQYICIYVLQILLKGLEIPFSTQYLHE